MAGSVMLTNEQMLEMQRLMQQKIDLNTGRVLGGGQAAGNVSLAIPNVPAVTLEPWEQEGANIRPDAILDAALMVLNTRLHVEKKRQQEYLNDVEKYRRALDNAERTLATHKIYIRQLEAGLELLKINEGIIKQGGG